MTRSTIARGAFATVILLAVAAGYRALHQDVHPGAAKSPAITPSTTPAAAHPAAKPHQTPEIPPGFLYGRITTVDGATYEGRMRWGGDQEALWGNYFNGYKNDNTWAAMMRPEDQPIEHVPLEIVGIRLGTRARGANLDRPFMARFGDIALIEPHDRDIRVTLKSGTAFVLNRFNADDLADGLRVWDATSGSLVHEGRFDGLSPGTPWAWHGPTGRVAFPVSGSGKYWQMVHIHSTGVKPPM